MNPDSQKNSAALWLGEPYERLGVWGWLVIYSTGVALLFFLLVHIWLVHYVSDQPITLKSVLLALRSPFVRTINLGVLFFSLIHGMMGLRRILLDMELFKKGGVYILNVCLFIAGLALFVWGLIIFNRLSPG